MTTSMNWADFLILGMLVISALFGLIRGMFKEVLSILTWVLAFIVAQSFWPALDYLLTPYMEEIPSIRKPLAWGILFVCSILVGSLLQRLVLHMVKVTGLSGTDRALGAVFGLLRGIIVVVLLLTFMPLIVDFSQDLWWNESTLIPVFSAISNSVMFAMQSLVEFIRGINLS